MTVETGEASRQSIPVSPISSSADGVSSEDRTTEKKSGESAGGVNSLTQEEIEEIMRDGSVIPVE